MDISKLRELYNEIDLEATKAKTLAESTADNAQSISEWSARASQLERWAETLAEAIEELSRMAGT
jgi:hypothetical protein